MNTALINSVLITFDITLNYLDDNNTSFTSGTWSMPESTLAPQLKTSLIINGQSARTESNNGAVTKPHPTHKASYINNTLAAHSRASRPGKGAQKSLLTAGNASHNHYFKSCILLTGGDPVERTIYKHIVS